MNSELKRVYGLDILRAVAILLVVLIHGTALIGESPIGMFTYLKIPDGVNLFFVLSGYLIGTILSKHITTEKFTLKPLLNFWQRRWFRTLPNYYLFLLIN